MATLQPAIGTLGLGAPFLGPWFDDPNLTLPAPDVLPGSGDLALALPLAQATTAWLPPAGGLLSLHVATPVRPPALARLRKPDGSPAFADDVLVAMFTLLPEVAGRLDGLSRVIAPADGSVSGGAPTRARVQSLALEFPDKLAQRLLQVQPWDDPLMTLADAAQHFGLGLSADLLTLDNDPHPMADMRQPGRLTFLGNFVPMVNLPQADSGLIRLHAFDPRGRPLDPGAVAAWWAALAAQYPEMWADGLKNPLPGPSPDLRTAPVAAALTLHLVNAHEGPIEAALKARLDMAAAGMLPLEEDGLLHTRQAAEAVTTLQFTAAPAGARDAAPVPRAAALPGGRYAAVTTLWANAAATPLTRDFVRVAVVELEEHLTGQKRIAPPQATPEQQRRADDQQRPSTRIGIAQSTAPALLASVDAAAAAALAVIGASNAQVVAGTLDADWGPLPGLPAAGPPPNWPVLTQLPVQVTVLALRGGDADANAVPKRGQRVLLRVSGLNAQAGWWLRAWPVGFDLETGQRPALTGGAGQVGLNGQVHLVMELPDGAGSGQLGVRVSLTAPGGFTRDYTELRIPRPNPAGLGSTGRPWGANGATQLLLCEQGQTLPLPLPAPPAAGSAVVASGTTAVEVLAGGFALIDRATIPAAVFAGLSAASSVRAGDALELTQPAFKTTPAGTVGAGGPGLWLGATLGCAQRSGLSPIISDSQPLASQERLDNATASRAASLGCLWTAPALSRYHQLGTHHAGHPGAPAAVELQGTGVALNGAAAHLLAEHVEDRIFKSAPALVNAATGAPAVPAPAPGATLWAAVLKTVAAAMEGDQQFGDRVVSPGNPAQAYTFAPADAGGTARAYESLPAQAGDIKKWYDDLYVQTVAGIDVMGTRLPGSNPGQPNAWSAAWLARAERAMDRRALEAGWGLREAMVSVAAALDRAEDFVYIETPALDQAAIGPDGEILLGRLLLRLLARPQLRAVLCLPERLLPGWPKGVELLRNQNLRNAIGAGGALGLAGGDRVAVFAPSAGQGRSLRLSATTVIVDDAYALTGSTHLWRRGLSFDGSLAAAVFDEKLAGGRPMEIAAFRRTLLAGRLGLPALRVPDDPPALVQAIQAYNQQRSARVGHQPLQMPKLPPSPPGPGWTSADGWNPDGSYKTGASVLDLLYAFLGSNQGELA
jgi:hypothetical protein